MSNERLRALYDKLAEILNDFGAEVDPDGDVVLFEDDGTRFYLAKETEWKVKTL